jgi:hypothetical protein
MFKKRFCNGTYLLLIVIFIACGNNLDKLDKKVIGKWTIESNVFIRDNIKGTEKQLNGLKIEFLSDKTYIATGLWGSGKWTILDDGRIKIEIPGIFAFASIGDLDNEKRMVIHTSYSPQYENIFVLKKEAAS